MADITSIQKLYSIVVTCVEMARDRGFDIVEPVNWSLILNDTPVPERTTPLPGYSNTDMTVGMYIFMMYLLDRRRGIPHTSDRGLLTLDALIFKKVGVVGEPTPSQKLFVGFAERESGTTLISKAIAEDFLALAKTRAAQSILIADAAFSPAANVLIAASTEPPVQLFRDSALTYSPIKHVFTPKHEVLSKEEAIKVRRDMGCKSNQLNFLDINDPVARYYNMQLRDMARITRINMSNPAGQTTISYRIVVPTKSN